MSDLQIPQHGSISGQKTTQQISVEGEIRIKLAVIWIVGLILVTITLGSIIGLILDEPRFGKHWPGIQAILSGAIFGFVGFIAGQKVGGGDR